MNELSTDWLKVVWSGVSGAVMTVLGYFLPIQNIILVLMLFFAIDALLGYLKAHKIDAEKFSQRKIWGTTVPRLGGSILLVMMAFVWDDVYGQSALATYNAIGWFLSGILLAKSAFNLYYLTEWKVFSDIGDFFTNKATSNSEINLTKSTEHENN